MVAINKKSKLYVGVPAAVPDKIAKTVTGSFTTTTAVSPGFGAAYEGQVAVPNPFGKRALPISRYTQDGTHYYTDFEQQNVVVVCSVTDTQVIYRWATNGSPVTISYDTVLIEMDT